jgi:hypothetical protein
MTPDDKMNIWHEIKLLLPEGLTTFRYKLTPGIVVERLIHPQDYYIPCNNVTLISRVKQQSLIRGGL